jgi:hypothetical protein
MIKSFPSLCQLETEYNCTKNTKLGCHFVVPDGPTEHDDILRDNRETRSENLQWNQLSVNTIYENPSFKYIHHMKQRHHK